MLRSASIPAYREESTRENRIPVTVLTGFLGSGKTTLLSKLLAKPGMDRVAVIINEFGEVGLDHLLVARPSENVTLLSSGCLCCSIRGDLVMTLDDLLARSRRGEIPEFTRVVVETSGLADPAPIVHAVIADAQTAAEYRLDGVITTVDAVNGESSLDRHYESVKQAAIADSLLLTKADLTEPAARERLAARLGRLNRRARQLEVRHGEVEPGVLFDISPSGREIADWLDLVEHSAGGGANPHLAHGPHDAAINTFSLVYDGPIREAGLDLWMDMLGVYRGPDLLRVKGLLNVEERPVVINGVQHVFHSPVTLAEWPSADRRSRIVFITRGLARGDLERTLSAFGFALPAPGLSRAGYARFVEAMKNFR